MYGFTHKNGRKEYTKTKTLKKAKKILSFMVLVRLIQGDLTEDTTRD